MTTRTATGGGMGLTKRQRDLLLFIQGFQARHGWSPSHDEMAEGIGVVSNSYVFRLLSALSERGHIRKWRFRKRGIKVLHPAPVYINGQRMRFIPVSALPGIAA